MAEYEKKMLEEGSPIMVGGGGGTGDDDVADDNISCTFKNADYPEAGRTGNKTEFRHPGWKIRTFKISAKGNVDDYSDRLPENGNCFIVVSCRGRDDDVVINGDAFGIDMNTATYEGPNHRNPNAESFIYRVDLMVLGRDPESWFFERRDKCAVCTDHVSPAESKCFN